MSHAQGFNGHYKQPTVMNNAAGKLRTIGIEFEFSGISLEDTARLVLDVLGGNITDETLAERTVKTDLGVFKVELDWDYLQRKAREQGEEVDDLSNGNWVRLLSKAAAWLVPVEMVCPPLRLSQLKKLEPMIKALRQCKVKGTSESLFAAYGTHINPEIPTLDAATLYRYLTAYSLLQWWLVEAHDINNTRRLSPYIDLYPEQYVLKILNQVSPSMEQLMEDYLKFNPSRNRALDLLPLFCEVDTDHVRSVVKDKKIKSRPTFHYRLPDCRVDEADWSLAQEWNKWWQVEKLAYDDDRRTELCDQFMSAKRPFISSVNRNRWVEHIKTWLDQE